MRHMIRISDYSAEELQNIYAIADEINSPKYRNYLQGKTVIMFFPNTSIRTRVTFEKGIYLLGGQTILFPAETLDKKEDLQDVIGYLNNWADLVIIRHHNIDILTTIAQYADMPIINAMTDINHPCEILSDIYALSKIRKNFRKDKFLFCGENWNIGKTWLEASKVFKFDLEQCCGRGYEISGLKAYYNINEAIIGKDIICTDSLPESAIKDFKNCQITKHVMEKANQHAILNPCPPFYRDESISKDVIDSDFFVGYSFKSCLLQVQQAIIINCLTDVYS